MDPTNSIPSPFQNTGGSSDTSDLGALFLDAFPLGVFLHQNNRFVYVNPKTCEILGKSMEELKTLDSLDEIVFSPDLMQVNDWFTRLCEKEAIEEPRLFRVLNPDTTLRRVIICGRRVLHKGISSILGSLMDVSDWMEAQHRQERARRLEVVAHLADYLGNDLNNLLSSILGNASLLRESTSSSTSAHEQLLEIETGAMLAADLTSRLIHVSGRRPLLQRAMNLNEAVEKAVNVTRNTTARHIHIRTRLAHPAKPIMGDPGLIEQAVIQLLMNACEAMPRGGTIQVSTSEVNLDAGFCRTHPELEPGEHMRVHIEDNGRGIAPELIDQVFDPFFSTKQDARGSGVGLTLVHNILHTHGGSIDLDSWLGQGASVDLYFPVTAPPSNEMFFPAPEIPKTQHTILVIDDDELARSTASRILQRHGFTVIEAERGEEGLRILGESLDSVDLVLLDLIMPGLSGRQTLEQLRRFAKGLPVVLISGHTVEIVDSDFRRFDVRHLVKKPYRPSDLVQVIKSAIAHRDEQPDTGCQK